MSDGRDIWTPQHRRVVLAIVITLMIALCVFQYRQPTFIPDPPPATGSRATELADRLDPNTADAAALAAIPELGEKRAAAIVDYRADFTRRHPGQPAFRSPRDFLKLNGIGLSTVENLKPYLRFPSAHPVP